MCGKLHTHMSIRQIKQTVQKLLGYKNTSSLILSLYLNNQNRCCGGKLAEDFRRLIDETAVEEEKKALDKEIMTIEAYLSEEYDNRKHATGIAIFAGKNLWEIIHFEFPVTSQITITHHPFLTPLTNELENTGDDLIVLADKRQAKLFLFHHGILSKQQTFLDNSIPQKIKANKGENYARNTKLLRTISNKIALHLARVSDAVAAFVKKNSVHGVFIGGHKPLIRAVEKSLQPNLRKKIRGEFSISLQAPQNEIIKKGQRAIAQASVV